MHVELPTFGLLWMITVWTCEFVLMVMHVIWRISIACEWWMSICAHLSTWCAYYMLISVILCDASESEQWELLALMPPNFLGNDWVLLHYRGLLRRFWNLVAIGWYIATKYIVLQFQLCWLKLLRRIFCVAISSLLLQRYFAMVAIVGHVGTNVTRCY